MPSKYKQCSRHEAVFDDTRCAASVVNRWGGVGFHQCHNKPLKDSEWCRVHSEEGIAARQKKVQQRCEDDRAYERKRNVHWWLPKASDEELLDEIARRGLVTEGDDE